MATLINDGWLYLTDGSDIMKLACEQITIDEDREPDITHYTGGGHYGYDLGSRWIIIKVKNIVFKTKANRETAVEKLDSWQAAGTITLKIQASSSEAYEKIDGSNTTLPVLHYGPKKQEKIAKGDGTVYVIGQIKFEQAGAASA
jgi:hypothetical protein